MSGGRFCSSLRQINPTLDRASYLDGEGTTMGAAGADVAESMSNRYKRAERERLVRV